MPLTSLPTAYRLHPYDSEGTPINLGDTHTTMTLSLDRVVITPQVEKAHAHLFQALQARTPGASVLIQVPSGDGKTTIARSFAARCAPPVLKEDGNVHARAISFALPDYPTLDRLLRSLHYSMRTIPDENTIDGLFNSAKRILLYVGAEIVIMDDLHHFVAFDSFQKDFLLFANFLADLGISFAAIATPDCIEANRFHWLVHRFPERHQIESHDLVDLREFAQAFLTVPGPVLSPELSDEFIHDLDVLAGGIIGNAAALLKAAAAYATRVHRRTQLNPEDLLAVSWLMDIKDQPLSAADRIAPLVFWRRRHGLLGGC